MRCMHHCWSLQHERLFRMRQSPELWRRCGVETLRHQAALECCRDVEVLQWGSALGGLASHPHSAQSSCHTATARSCSPPGHCADEPHGLRCCGAAPAALRSWSAARVAIGYGGACTSIECSGSFPSRRRMGSLVELQQQQHCDCDTDACILPCTDQTLSESDATHIT